MPQLSLENIIEILKEFTRETNTSLCVILVGGLALQYYGMKDRATIDIDAEVKGEIEGLFNFLKLKGIPSDIGENLSGWSVIAMPPGYRERAITIFDEGKLLVKVLHPLDFVIAKLRRAMEIDLDDAVFVVKKFGLAVKDIEKSAEEAIADSSKDTTVFVFRKNVGIFVKRLRQTGMPYLETDRSA